MRRLWLGRQSTPLSASSACLDLFLRGCFGYLITQSSVNSIQSACRQFRSETQDWPSFAMFHFKSTVKFVDFFSRADYEKRLRIRNARVKSFPLPIYHSEEAADYSTLFFDQVLSVFTGLQFDLLTVEDCFHDPGVNDGWGDGAAHFEFNNVLQSDGWKEVKATGKRPVTIIICALANQTIASLYFPYCGVPDIPTGRGA